MPIRRLLHAILPCLLLLGTPASVKAAEIVLNCRWLCPTTRAPLAMSFTKNPMLVVLPGDTLHLTCDMGGIPGQVTVLTDNQPAYRDASLAFTAPDNPGSYYIHLELTASDARREAEICVLVPHKATAKRTADQGLDVFVDDREIGHYRHPSRSGNIKVRENPDSYQPPVWWLRLTDMNAAFEVVPGLTAGELVVPSEDTGEQHIDMAPVNYPMWRAIFTLRNALQEKGIPGAALKLISMFRAPHYNRGIGSNAFGRHIFGDAFDFYIDLEGNGKASDLNHDRKLDRRDAYVVVAIIEDLQADGKIPMGGIGVYNSVAGDHEVTMHLDMRGHRATWGYVYPMLGKRGEFSWASRRFAELDRQGEEQARLRAEKAGKKYVRPRREPLP